MGKTIYLAGPMSGYPDFNFPAFYAAEDKLVAEGWEVFNPADKEQERTHKKLNPESFASGTPGQLVESGFDFRTCYIWDVTKVCEADAIYMLPGWQYSPGACGEHAVAVAMKRHYPDYQIIYE